MRQGVATRAAKNATSTVPIVFAVVIDPVAGGLVPDRQRPGAARLGTYIDARLEIAIGFDDIRF